MGKIIKFQPKASKKTDTPVASKEAIKMLAISEKIDAIILEELEKGDINAKELVGLLAHRLGALLKHLDHKPELWSVIEKVAKEQAAMDF